MICWAGVFVLLCVGCASGRPRLPPLRLKDGCFMVTPEVDVFRLEGEAVVLPFFFFTRALEVRSITPPPAGYLIRRENWTEEEAPQEGGRVQQHGTQLWLLPAQASDSGEYTCTYRNGSFCIRGSITLQVMESWSVDVELLSHPMSADHGQPLSLSCPFIDVFNGTDGQVQWFKDSDGPADGSFQQDGDELTIPAVKSSHAGLYTCRLPVSINQQQFTVSRLILLDVQGTDPETTTNTPTHSTVTSDSRLPSSSAHTPQMKPPLIMSPRNGSVYESPHGSGLEISCLVLTDCGLADSTEVVWLVNNRSVEDSYLDRRALQGGRRVTGWSGACRVELRLLVTVITEEDDHTEVKCVAQNEAGIQEVVTHLHLEDSTVTWIIVAAVAASCFLTVVSVFLCVLFKPERKKRKMDYFLARQNSTF